MKYLRISISLISLCLLASSLYSQVNKYGTPFITNYSYTETCGSEQNWCITQDHRGVVYVGTQDKGILEYDGFEWRIIPIPNDVPVRSLVTGDDGVIYVGAEGDFGRLEPDLHGQLSFHSLYDSTLLDKITDITIWKTYYDEGKVYFCSWYGIFVFDPLVNNIQIIETPETGYFSFIVDHQLYNLDWGNGLMLYNGESFENIPGGDLLHEMLITGLEKYGDNKLLISTMTDGMYVFDTRLGTIDDTFLDQALMDELISVQIPYMTVVDNQILVATFHSGLYILDMNGHVQEIISQAEGLEGMTISQVYADNQPKGSKTLWFAHWSGVSKVELDSPIRSQIIGSTTSNISGKSIGEFITGIASFNEKLFVSTREGLYYQYISKDKTRYISIPEIQTRIYDLQVIEPVPGKPLLLASSDTEIYVLDERLNVTIMNEMLVNPPGEIEDLEQISGNVILASPNKKNMIYTGDYELVGIQYTNGRWKEVIRTQELDSKIHMMVADKYGYIWISTRSDLIRFDPSEGAKVAMKTFTSENGLPGGVTKNSFLNPETQEILIGTDSGFYGFDYFNEIFIPDNIFNSVLPQEATIPLAVHKDKDGEYWFSFLNEQNEGTELVASKKEDTFEVIFRRPFKRLPKKSVAQFVDDHDQGVWFSKSSELYHFDKSNTSEEPGTFQTLIRDVSIFGDSSIFNGTNFIMDSPGSYRTHSEQIQGAIPKIKYLYNNITFSWSATFYKSEEQTMYSYLLEGSDYEWSKWDLSNSARYTNLSYGYYTMHVKTKNVYGEESPPSQFSFIILRPWYASIFAFLLYIFLIGFVVLYIWALKKRAVILTKKNREIEFQKTELENLNEEITAQRDEIEAQRDSITAQKDLIDEQKTAMTDSILYARRIQDAVLPAEEVMRFLLPKHFVFYRPQHIVSGDFFWIDKKDETVLLALGDCTGHGVPGAFMSMLGISLLNEISSKFTDHSTNEIVDELRDQVIASLGQTGNTGEAQDGMDLGMIAINLKTREIQFTGAQHNLYIFRKGELEVVKGDRMPVGIHTRANKLFQAHNFKLNRGDSIYLFSDGFPDQFGGEKGKKYSYPRLKTLLTDLQEMIMHDQLSAIAEEFDKWKGDEEQIDDVLMIGIKL